MANIVIKDLIENVDLDRDAMRKITGGKAVQRIGIPSFHSNCFRNPCAFSELRVLPSDLGLTRDPW